MNPVFGPGYASVYDLLYQDKDYAGECDLLTRLFADFGVSPIGSVLDLGCGTGGHALPLARRGFRVTGVDAAPAMLDLARAKAATGAGPAAAIDFVHADIRTFQLGRLFDAAIMMFAVLGYQREDVDVLSTLSAVRGHLVPGGLFLFDCWHGPAVLALRPEDRVRTIGQTDGQIVRTARTDLDIDARLCRVNFTVTRTIGEQRLEDVQETHAMRFFFADELRTFLAAAGFRLEALRAFPDTARLPDETSWSVIAIARTID
ncbi:MAG: class I SAM-dependent methyltransferase [Niveispirillum sp.]|uniref:class I SAM-dependent DNA methyltransferase n=1 Tax=Asticcacaulis sp. TaxID=1872648 RepID=UPI001A210293|nr:class I SAM-dependent methyltransferase [Asticcacaulis sp.]MBJ7418160.1 class I SAM-dependent methyltransferase [Niveispirillum sp.]